MSGLVLCCAFCLHGCAATRPDSAGADALDLVCHALPPEPPARGCTATPSLLDGSLRLLPDGRFVLVGRYAACHAAAEMRIGGRYAASERAGGSDVVLLAEAAAGDAARADGRRFGVLDLDAARREGRFVEAAAAIRADELSSAAPQGIAMRCSEGRRSPASRDGAARP